MKVNINREMQYRPAEKVRIETENIILDITVQSATGELVLRKVDGKEDSTLKITPSVSNQIYIS